MTDPPLQSWSRFIAIDIHKHYLMIGGIDGHKRVVLPPRRVELSRWPDWAQANLVSSNAAPWSPELRRLEGEVVARLAV